MRLVKGRNETMSIRVRWRQNGPLASGVDAPPILES